MLTLSILQHTVSAFPTWHAPPTLYGATLSRTKEKNHSAEKASMSLTRESLSLKWWRVAGGDWRAVSWYGDDGQGNDGGEKRGFDEAFKEDFDGR